VFLKDLEDFDVKKKKHDLSKGGMREGKVMACTVVVQEWKLVMGWSKRVASFPALAVFYLFCFLILSTVKFKRGNFWGVAPPFRS